MNLPRLSPVAVAGLAGAVIGYMKARSKRKRVSGAVVWGLAGVLFASKVAPALGIQIPALGG